MSIKITTISLILICSVIPQDARAKGWKGIIPLHSSKSDVWEKLGPPNGGPLVTYRFDDMNVNIIYSSKPCQSGWNVPVGTVLRISIQLAKNRPQISDLDLDLSYYKMRRDPELLDIRYYESKNDGIIYVTWKDEVMTIEYGPSVNDNKLKCRDN